MRRARLRAPVSFLIAACLGTFAGAQTSAVAVDPAAAGAGQNTAGRSAASFAPGTTLAAQLAAVRAKRGAHQPAAATQARAAGGVTPACEVPRSKNEARCFALHVDGTEAGKGLRSASDLPHGLTPSDLTSAYNLPKDGGAGATIAIVDAYDNPNVAADLAVYRAQYGLPPLKPGQFTKVNERGLQSDYPAADEGWAAEISLDVDMVSAIAPQASIILVEADTPSIDNLGAGVDQAVALGATYVSNSYGTAYSSIPGSGESPDDVRLSSRYYDHPGAAIVASSGDGNYGVSFPASSPYVTSVGGTSLVRDASTARGWSETTWNSHGGGPGSGCSLVQPKPAFQKDTGCAQRTVADVSAVADPVTGVSVYDTFGSTYGTGWAQYGGTSAASPIIAATYALAGSLPSGVHPNSFPYAHPGSLNDVTSGSNGTCEPAYLCQAGPGYDGPTGLGTPNGTAAFSSGPSGLLSGTVTDGSSGKPVSGAEVRVTGASTASAVTGSDGTYRMRLSTGSYEIAVSAFDYDDRSVDGITVSADTTSTADVKLTGTPMVTVSGTVADASGHGWPLYAKVTVENTPLAPVYSDPVTGRYSVQVPENGHYTLHAAANYRGYTERDTSVTTKTKDSVHDIGLTAQLLSESGSAPGYTQQAEGSNETFDGTTAPAGWSVDTAVGDPWLFERGFFNYGNFGQAHVEGWTGGKPGDTSLTSPDFQVPAGETPFVYFNTRVNGGLATVEYSTDGGRTWTTGWSESGLYDNGAGFALPDSGKAVSVRLKFRYQQYTGGAGAAAGWFLYDVRVGGAKLVKQPGGLVVGNITDGNTAKPMDGATVAVANGPAQSTLSAPMAGRAGREDGFYWFFSPLTGRQSVTATMPFYKTASEKVKLVADRTTGVDLALHAGRLKLGGPVSGTVAQGGSATRDLTLTNTGDAPLKVKLDESTGTAAPAWTAAGSLPTEGSGMVGGSSDGTLYAGLGSGVDAYVPTAAFYAYDQAGRVWRQKADAPSAVASASGAFIGGKFYVTGGYWVAPDFSSLGIETRTQVYDPATDTWAIAADNPDALAGAGTAVLDGKLYAVGGMTTEDAFHATVSVYDPRTNKWSAVHSYPERVYGASCGAIAGKLYCAGGVTNLSSGGSGGREVKDAFVYDPARDSWTRIADLPIDMAQSAYGVADGRLLVSGGFTANASDVTGQAYAYDPAMDWWFPLPGAQEGRNNAVGVVGAGGFHAIGGTGPDLSALATVSVLSGYDTAEPVDVPWLSESRTVLTIQPGRQATVRVRLDARGAVPARPGTVSASLGFEIDGPYGAGTVPVSMTVQPRGHGAVGQH
ncbi:carboxypeptidase regulatory-like domain-containing protein [Streptacidiphilus griseoplanus]|uniref:carboxypeptidase regulatory-like domain-containing protein n=1 Tax=Peterkaempfera griseoplana TaxID=66896 RepID=UPI0012FEB1EF|nr:carboxypeptidase regulatory-like domain-containing protein [Peterkaempfera griseoplana]